MCEKTHLVNVKTVLKIIDKYLSALKESERHEDYYPPLVDLGVIDEDGIIISDPYYDQECISFAKRLLKKIRDEIERIG